MRQAPCAFLKRDAAGLTHSWRKRKQTGQKGAGGCSYALRPTRRRGSGRRKTARAITRPDVIVGVTVETDALHEAALAVECLLWVQAETPELRNDRVATREVRERLQEATQRFPAQNGTG